MTADYDQLLDEPDYKCCQIHGYVMPCPICRQDAEDERADWAISEGGK